MLGWDRRGRIWAVSNQGASVNRLLISGRGPNALSRFDRDVMSVPGATHVVVLEGINDIGKVRDPAQDLQPPAERLNAAYEQLLAREIGRASCRQRVWTYVSSTVVDVSVSNKTEN